MKRLLCALYYLILLIVLIGAIVLRMYYDAHRTIHAPPAGMAQSVWDNLRLVNY